MKAWSFLAASLVLAAMPASSARGAAAEPAEKSDFDTVELAHGLSVSVGLLRVGPHETAEPPPLQGHVVERVGGITRLVFDEASGAAFGYRVDAAGLSAGLVALRIDLRPLAPGDDKPLERVEVCDTCPTPRLLVGSGPTRFPPTQIVKNGDTMVVDLLVRPDTGEKIVDVLKFSREPMTEGAFDALRTRLAGAARHVLRGGQLARDGTADAAMAEYEKAVQLNAADVDAWHQLGVLRHRKGSYGRAVTAYRQALKLRADRAVTRRNLAAAHLDRAELAQAVEEYKRAYRVSPDVLESRDADVVPAQDTALEQYAFAKVYAAAGRTDAALACLKAAKEAGFTDLERVHEDPDFKRLLRDPRLGSLM